MNASTPSTSHARPWRRHPLIRFLSSVWLGVVLLTLILIYASVVSALPQVRGAIEMTEMQVFRHWVFVSLVALFCISLTVSTLTRCPWNLIGLGALIVHAGVLLMIIGTARYFATKIEGDVLLMSPRVQVVSLTSNQPQRVGRLLAETGQSWEGRVGGGQFATVEVLATEGAGLQPVTDAALAVTINNRPPQEVAVTADNPQGTRVGNIALRLMSFEPVTEFFDDEVTAMYCRRQGAEDYALPPTPLHGLPWHRERYLDEGYFVLDTAGNPVPSKRTAPQLAGISTAWFEHWQLPIDAETPDWPFEITVTGYLPYTSQGDYDVVTRDGQRIDRSEIGKYNPNDLIAVPRVVPVPLRRPGMRRGPSAIRVHIRGKGEHADWSTVRWCSFSAYPHVDVSAALVQVPWSAETWELVFSRMPRDFGAALVGRKLSVDFFPGRRRVESWRSDFIVQTSPQTTPVPAAVYTNQTYPVGPWTLFQSGAAGDHWSWTILGVGNRRGMWPMGLGSILIVVGTLYAYYVKPLVLRQRTRRNRPPDKTEPNTVGGAA